MQEFCHLLNHLFFMGHVYFMYWYCRLDSDYNYLPFSVQHLSVYTRLKITVFSSF